MLGHLVVGATALSVASYFHAAPFWQVGSSMLPVYWLCLGYVALVAIYPVLESLRLDAPLLPPAGFCALAGLIFLGLLLSPRHFSKLTLISTFALLLAAVSLFYLLPRFRSLWTGLFAGLLVGSIVLLVRPAAEATSALDGEFGFVTKSVRTSVHDLEVRTYEGIVPRSRTHLGIGALERIEDTYVVAMANGDIYSIRGVGVEPVISVSKWSSEAPLNYDEFLAAARESSYAAYFRVSDVLLMQGTEVQTLFVSHHFWDVENSCATLRVSSLTFNSLAQLEREDLKWSTVFETTPCFGLQDDTWAFRGMEGGGRLGLSGGELLLTVGDHGFNGVDFDRNWVDDPTASYGKVLSIDPETGDASVFTTGHRNPQGLLVTEAGVVWSTDHGPEGGDELVLLERGSLHGWPSLTFGTHYGELTWSVEKPENEAIYTAPVYSWVPSIAVSNLTDLGGSGFERWESDLLIGSLHSQELYRMRIEDGVVRFAEPISLGDRVRDLLADENGILIWGESRSLIHILPAS